jgi:glutathione S-transferase
MKLYYAPGACSLAPHIIAREAGIELDLHRVEFTPHGKFADGGDYTAINLKGAVPALEFDDGQVLTENAVVLQYLAACAPESGCMPVGEGTERWRVLELLNFIATELHKGFAPLFHGASGEARATVVRELGRRLDYLEAVYGGRPWLSGERFTIADAYGFAVLRWTGTHKIDTSPWPGLEGFMQRVRARPAVQQAMHEEGIE